MAHDVFISYATKDKPIADAVCAKLEGRSIRCWIAPRDILPGIPYAESIMEAIEGSRLMVLVFTSGSNNSQHVWREVEGAVNSGVVIIPFRVENVPLSRSLKYYISNIHWLDALTPPLDQHLKALADNVAAMLAKHTSGVTSVVPIVEVPGPLEKSPPVVNDVELNESAANWSELTQESCRLLNASSQLHERFNCLAAHIHVLAERPLIVARDEMLQIARDLTTIHSQLTRERWQVAFCGMVQAGKSTTLNRMVNATPKNAPLSVGNRTATTSSIVRIHTVPGDQPASLQLRFQSPREYREVRDRLCDLAGLATTQSDAEILRHEGTGKVQNDSALERLKNLLLAFQRFGKTKVTDPPCIESRQYSDRAQWLAFPRLNETTTSPSLAPLIYEAVVGFPTDALPAHIELVDLPGFGAELTSDMFLRATHDAYRALPEADAVFVFFDALTVAYGHNPTTLPLLRANPGRPVWLVFTSMDSLSEYGLHLFIDMIPNYTAEYDIPIEQVCLIASPSGQRQYVAPVWKSLQVSPFAEAFEALNADGGISRLRAVLTDVLPKLCAARLKDTVEQSLTALEAQLERVSQLALPSVETPR